MDTLKKVGAWIILKEKVKQFFSSQNEKSSTFGETTFKSKEPMKTDSYRKNGKNLNI